jgi:hypothetical protein
MAERKTARLRLLLLGLVAANLLVFTFLQVRTDPKGAAATRIEEVQINAGSVKLLAAATRGAGQSTAADPGLANAPCLEWGPLTSEEAPAAASALEKLAFAHPPVRRPAADSGGSERFVYFVREPDTKTVAQIAALQRMFPRTQIRAGTCPDDIGATSGK